MDETASASMENLVISRFRELSDDGKRRLMAYVEFLYQTEKSPPEDRHLSAQQSGALDHLVKDVQMFSEDQVKTDAQRALRRICRGIFESEENLASNHDFFLYGAPKRK